MSVHEVKKDRTPMVPTHRLTKICSTHNNLQTDVVEGVIVSLPEVGRRFNIFSDSLEKSGDCRQISTSGVVELEKLESGEDCDEPELYRFKTHNSTYELLTLFQKAKVQVNAW